jgi:hypothetical protein
MPDPKIQAASAKWIPYGIAAYVGSSDCDSVALVSERRNPEFTVLTFTNTGWVKVPVKFPAIAVAANST